MLLALTKEKKKEEKAEPQRSKMTDPRSYSSAVCGQVITITHELGLTKLETNLPPSYRLLSVGSSPSLSQHQGTEQLVPRGRPQREILLNCLGHAVCSASPLACLP